MVHFCRRPVKTIIASKTIIIASKIIILTKKQKKNERNKSPPKKQTQKTKYMLTKKQKKNHRRLWPGIPYGKLGSLPNDYPIEEILWTRVLKPPRRELLLSRSEEGENRHEQSNCAVTFAGQSLGSRHPSNHKPVVTFSRRLRWKTDD